MKKPICKWAIVLWIAAGAFAVIQAFNFVPSVSIGALSPFELIGSIVLHSFFQVGLLAGMGALIELVDQIRWNALHPPK